MSTSTFTPDPFLLTLSCPNRPGIVAGVAASLFEAGRNILQASPFDDIEPGRFFMRVVVNVVREGMILDAVRADFAPVAERFGLDHVLRWRGERRRALILVSKFDHCLADLLHRWRTRELAMDLVGVASNHPQETYAHLDFEGVPFHHLPVTEGTKVEREAPVWDLVRKTGADLVVLARYMQVLSDELAAKLSGRRSTSITRSCRASKARSRTTKPMPAA